MATKNMPFIDDFRDFMGFTGLHAMPGIAALKAISFAPNSHVKNQERVDNKLLSARRSQTENQRTKMIELS